MARRIVCRCRSRPSSPIHAMSAAYSRSSRGGYDQCYNAQAVVAVESLLVIAVEVVQAPNDKQQVAPMLGKIDALPEDLGRPETLLADNGYFSEANVTLCEAANIEPLIALGRQPHHRSLRERFAAAPHAPRQPTYRKGKRLNSSHLAIT